MKPCARWADLTELAPDERLIWSQVQHAGHRPTGCTTVQKLIQKSPLRRVGFRYLLDATNIEYPNPHRDP